MRGPVPTGTLRLQAPRIGVVFVSGYTEESQDLALATEDPSVKFLEKPFRRAALMEAVALAMHARQTG